MIPGHHELIVITAAAVIVYLSSILICECSSWSITVDNCDSSSNFAPQPITLDKSFPVPNGSMPI